MTFKCPICGNWIYDDSINSECSVCGSDKKYNKKKSKNTTEEEEIELTSE